MATLHIPFVLSPLYGYTVHRNGVTNTPFSEKCTFFSVASLFTAFRAFQEIPKLPQRPPLIVALPVVLIASPVFHFGFYTLGGMIGKASLPRRSIQDRETMIP